MASSPHLSPSGIKPLDPSAAPFFPTARLLSPDTQHGHPHYHHQPHQPAASYYFCHPIPRKSPFVGRRVHILPPRLTFAPRHSSLPKPRWVPKVVEKESFYAEETTYSTVPAGDDVVGEKEEAPERAMGLAGSTTVMMRHLPNTLKRHELIKMLDEHCRKENERATKTRSEYDFVYLPIDFENMANKGYAFINFTSSEAAMRMCRAFHDMRWECFYASKHRWSKCKKVCHICPASIQGKNELEAKLRHRMFPREDFRPLKASASPRDGINGVPLSPVGLLRRS